MFGVNFDNKVLAMANEEVFKNKTALGDCFEVSQGQKKGEEGGGVMKDILRWRYDVGGEFGKYMKDGGGGGGEGGGKGRDGGGRGKGQEGKSEAPDKDFSGKKCGFSDQTSPPNGTTGKDEETNSAEKRRKLNDGSI